MTAPPIDSSDAHFRANAAVQASAHANAESLPPAPQSFPEYGGGVQVLTDPAGIDPSGSKVPQNPVMGSPSLPVFIKVKKDPEPGFMRFLHILQVISGIFFIFFIIAVLISILTGENSPMGGSLLNAAGSHHQTIISSPFRFVDVQGCDEVKAQLEQVVDFLKNPLKYEQFGANMPRGYLLEGPPGVGKTLLAKAVAGEAGVPFIVISGAEFDEVYVGVGASRVRSLFADARKHSKAVIFIDEIDGVAGKRTSNERSGSRQTLNQLLVEMDGFKTTSSVIVLGATNTVQSLDQALLRPGRFDKTLTILPPDILGRKQILKQLFSTIPKQMLGADVESDSLAATTIGYTGADLANLVNQAKLIAATDGSSGVIDKAHLVKAKSFIDLGPARNMILSKEDKERVAYHEAGHATVGLSNPSHDPILHATIVPHSRSLGLVLSGPETDQAFTSKAKLEARIDMTLGGFTAEELQYGAENVSTGPSSDLAAVNRIARLMVSSGFGKRTGFLQIPESAFEASEAAKKNFEDDVQDILSESRIRVRKILLEHKASWHAIAKALMEKESLDRQEIESLYENPSPAAALKSKKPKVKAQTTSIAA